MNPMVDQPETPRPERDRPDACPGTRRVHIAADGAIGRLRFPGGFLPAPGFMVLADLADNFGDGYIHFTSRGNLQIRGIRDVSAFADAAEEAGMLPHPDHDRVRNILQSPMTGRVGGLDDVSELVHAFDDALCADESLAALPGRTLFALDDGRGDVLGEAPDLGLVALGGGEFELVVAGAPAGVSVPRDRAVEMLLSATRAWAEVRGEAWRIAESDGADRVVAMTAEAIGVPVGDPSAAESFAFAHPGTEQIGWIDQPGGLVSLAAGLRFGVLPSRLARAIAQTRVPVHVTPWYSLVLHDLEEADAEQVVRVLAPNGLIFDRKSTWLNVSACTGRPGCSKSLADTRGDAAHAIAQARLPEGRVHFSGCERRCGRPKGGYVDYLATGDGEYEVTSVD
ncbi:precorrin-3B synthase [Corynebacterium freneyi]|uniref:precorrin-3B synthase n=1 Tax=Corynebacterium freneyi TaxID=134034 RepID=UPI001EF16B6B|nr:precorrin-3B synthase [Corynebacterium freneyi]MCG7437921.1 precorrin-3B synthase [Corynebacterium freneyi]